MVPTLQTNRFFLQEIKPEDQAFIYEGLSHPQVIPFYGVSYSSFEETSAQMRFYADLIKNDTGTWWKIVDKSTMVKVGAIGYNNHQHIHRKAEIGYWLLHKFWKQGIAGEVLPIVLQYMITKKSIHRVEALIEEGNIASSKLMEKAGFTYEGKMRDCEIKNGKFISLYIYSYIAE